MKAKNRTNAGRRSATKARARKPSCKTPLKNTGVKRGNTYGQWVADMTSRATHVVPYTVEPHPEL